MNWFNLLAYSAAWFSILLVWIRVDRRARWTSLVFFTVPGVGLLCFWALYRDRYLEMILGLVIGFFVWVLWWRLLGRRLPPSDSAKIKVWGQEQ